MSPPTNFHRAKQYSRPKSSLSSSTYYGDVPRDPIDADVSEPSSLYLSDTVDQDGRDSGDGAGTERRQTCILKDTHSREAMS